MLIPFTAKWNANNACIAFCEGNGSIDSWAIIKNEAALSGIKILATVTKNWLIEVWVLAYPNTNNSGFRRISRAARHGPQAHSLLLIYLQLSQPSLSISQLVFEVQGQKWISEGLLGDNTKCLLGHEILTYKNNKKSYIPLLSFLWEKAEHTVSMIFINTFNMHFIEAEISKASIFILLLKIVLLTERSVKLPEHESITGYSTSYEFSNNLQYAVCA